MNRYMVVLRIEAHDDDIRLRNERSHVAGEVLHVRIGVSHEEAPVEWRRSHDRLQTGHVARREHVRIVPHAKRARTNVGSESHRREQNG
jgi:hypothetical protein